MASKRKGSRFQRITGKSSYRSIFLLSLEGRVSEPEYFNTLKQLPSLSEMNIKIECLKKGNKSAPKHLLKKMEFALNKHKLGRKDEAWIILDRDSWEEEHINDIYQWTLKQTKYKRGLALSNPNFEYWLLLHFEDGKNISNSHDCARRLRQHLPNYDKRIDVSKFTETRIEEALYRAKIRDNPPCKDWPRNIGKTTVYRLIDNIFMVANS